MEGDERCQLPVGCAWETPRGRDVGDLLAGTMPRKGPFGFVLAMAILAVDAAALRPLATQHITPFRATRACARMGWAEAKKKREEEERVRFEEMEVPASRLTPRPPPSPPPHCPAPPPPPPSPSPPSPRRHRCSHRHRHRQELRAREAEKREAAAKLEREQAAEKRRTDLARVQEYQDNVDFDRPGGVLRKAPATLTKRDLENAQVSPNPDPDPNPNRNRNPNPNPEPNLGRGARRVG